LKKAKDRLTSAIEAMEAGFVLFNSDDKLIMCNKKYLNLYKRPFSIIAEKPTFEDLIRDGINQKKYRPAIGKEKEWIDFRLEIHKKANQTFELELSDGKWVKVTEKKIKDSETVGLHVDITQFKKIQAELEEAKKEAEEVNIELKKALEHANQMAIEAELANRC